MQKAAKAFGSVKWKREFEVQDRKEADKENE